MVPLSSPEVLLTAAVSEAALVETALAAAVDAALAALGDGGREPARKLAGSCPRNVDGYTLKAQSPIVAGQKVLQR